MSDCCGIEGVGEGCGIVMNDESTISRCVECGVEGRPVERQTILHHVKHEHLDRVDSEPYRFCPDPNCEIVYYSDRGTRFTVNHLRELVSAKTTGDLVGAADLIDWMRRMEGNGVSSKEGKMDWAALMRFKNTFTDPVPENREKGYAKAGIAAFHGPQEVKTLELNARSLLSLIRMRQDERLFSKLDYTGGMNLVISITFAVR